jgi:tetratricopeptide (TPR) repeat protein
VTGLNRKKGLDYAGAIAAFERALQTNPRSAAAHFELGLLYYNNVSDWPAALYHFERFRRLRPDSNRIDFVNQCITACKQELVKDVPLGTLNDQMQRELSRLTGENTNLRLQLDQLRTQVVARVFAPATNAPPAGAGASPDPPTQPAAPPRRSYMVKAGDNPYAIARRHGLKLAELLAANPGLDPRRLRPGQTLVIPSR